MIITKNIPWLFSFTLLFTMFSCDEQGNAGTGAGSNSGGVYKEGADYMLYERVRAFDKVGFSEPQEAFSLLLPKGWQHRAGVKWNEPGSACAGTYKSLSASSADNKYSLEMYPDIVYMWSSNQQLMQFNQNNNVASANCAYRQPIDAENYLRNIFVQEELGNPEIITITPNQYVVEQMRQQNETTTSELRQYGAGEMNFYQTAVNAVVKWPGGTDGLVVLGVTVLETVIPNIYNGSYSKSYTTQVSKRIVYKYPNKDSVQAKNQFSLVMGSFRSNPAWNDAVNNFWRDVRQQKHVAHIGKIRMLDEQTRRMGEQAIKNGETRLKNMDNDLRNWEASQSSQDRMHTNFIKTIREVENFKDESGTYELSSGYAHAWSRGDGNSFVMSDNPNFDPAFIFKDQSWKAMKKTD